MRNKIPSTQKKERWKRVHQPTISHAQNECCGGQRLRKINMEHGQTCSNQIKPLSSTNESTLATFRSFNEREKDCRTVCMNAYMVFYEWRLRQLKSFAP